MSEITDYWKPRVQRLEEENRRLRRFIQSKAESVLPTMWVIYKSPSDIPNYVVARRWHNNEATQEHLEFDTVELAHAHFEKLNMTFIERFDNDDPVIVGVWV